MAKAGIEGACLGFNMRVSKEIVSDSGLGGNEKSKLKVGVVIVNQYDSGNVKQIEKYAKKDTSVLKSKIKRRDDLRNYWRDSKEVFRIIPLMADAKFSIYIRG